MITCSNCGTAVRYGSEHVRDNGTHDSVTWICATADGDLPTEEELTEAKRLIEEEMVRRHIPNSQFVFFATLARVRGTVATLRRRASENLPTVYKVVPSTSAIPWLIEGPGLDPKFLYFVEKGEADTVARALNQAYGIGHTFGRGAGR